MDRLVSLHRLPPTEQMDMFAMAGHGNGNQPRSRDELVADALVRQAAKVAYVGAKPVAGIDGWENDS